MNSEEIKQFDSYPYIRFIINAPSLLPELYKEGDFTLLKNFIDNWNLSPAPSVELIFAIRSLIEIQTNTFSSHRLPSNFLSLLDDYTQEIERSGKSPEYFKYYISMPYARYSYDATNDAEDLLRFIRSWAKNIIATKTLDSSESFICRVIEGNIQKPISYFKINRSNYKDLSDFQDTMNIFRERCFIRRRNATKFTANFLSGVWLPQGNLKILGVHPSLGMQIGWRSQKNEYDFTWCVRFLSPTPSSYKVFRSDSLYNSNYYDGGYAGFDYTHFIIHKPHYDVGLIAAVAYDYFDAFNGIAANSDIGNVIPINIGSFDLNGGMQLKYFIGRGPFIGIQAKYHLINYANTGGTDLNGNAFTIDLSFGVR
jgi:hypothetical protein